MDVSIILVSYNTKELTKNCIKSIYEKTFGINYEILVVDNNSLDGSVEMIKKEFPNVTLIKNQKNIGFGAANNIAIKKSNAKYVFCLNTDTILLNNAIKIMFDFMEMAENKNVGACGGNLLDRNMKPTYSFASFPNVWTCTSIHWLLKRLVNKYYAPKRIKNIKSVDFITGAQLFLRKSILDKIGFFDENIFMYSEDVDLCKRIKDKGFDIKAIPTPLIIHLEGASNTLFYKRIKRIITGKYYYLHKYNYKIAIISMKITYIVLHLFCYIFTLDKNHLELLSIHLKSKI